MLYPIHTPVSAITRFDRSTKVFFECSIHEDSKWMSKQPSCSQWFAVTDNGYDCGCSMSGDTWWTSEEYNDGDEATKGQAYGSPEVQAPEDYRVDVFDGDTLVAVFADEEDAATYVSVINDYLGSSYYFKAHEEN